MMMLSALKIDIASGLLSVMYLGEEHAGKCAKNVFQI